MRYEITSHKGECYNVTGSDDRGTYVYYRGTYDAERDLWRLVPKAGTPAGYAQVLFVPSHMVRWLKQAQTKPVLEKKPKPADKPKPYWTLPDPPGQLELV